MLTAPRVACAMCLCYSRQRMGTLGSRAGGIWVGCSVQQLDKAHMKGQGAPCSHVGTKLGHKGTSGLQAGRSGSSACSFLLLSGSSVVVGGPV